jgi:hypothetical protein
MSGPEHAQENDPERVTVCCDREGIARLTCGIVPVRGGRPGRRVWLWGRLARGGRRDHGGPVAVEHEDFGDGLSAPKHVLGRQVAVDDRPEVVRTPLPGIEKAGQGVNHSCPFSRTRRRDVHPIRDGHPVRVGAEVAEHSEPSRAVAVGDPEPLGCAPADEAEHVSFGALDHGQRPSRGGGDPGRQVG